MTSHRGLASAFALIVALAGCSPTSAPSASGGAPSVAPSAATTVSVAPTGTSGFPTEAFAGLGDESVAAARATERHEVLDTSANGHGLTAAVIAPEGTWSPLHQWTVDERLATVAPQRGPVGQAWEYMGTLANAEHDVDAVAGELWRAANTSR